MPSLYNEADVKNILERLEKLTPESQRLWGTMNVAQMLAHCNVSLETAMGLNFPRRKLIGRLLGPLLKWKYLDAKPMVKNSITEDTYVTSAETFDFETEKRKAMHHVQNFYTCGPKHCTQHPHSYFGKLSPQEWATLKWKHFDHHLRQFGV